jgi:hypothetical protein
MLVQAACEQALALHTQGVRAVRGILLQLETARIPPMTKDYQQRLPGSSCEATWSSSGRHDLRSVRGFPSFRRGLE